MDVKGPNVYVCFHICAYIYDTADSILKIASSSKNQVKEETESVDKGPF